MNNNQFSEVQKYLEALGCGTTIRKSDNLTQLICASRRTVTGLSGNSFWLTTNPEGAWKIVTWTGSEWNVPHPTSPSQLASICAQILATSELPIHEIPSEVIKEAEKPTEPKKHTSAWYLWRLKYHFDECSMEEALSAMQGQGYCLALFSGQMFQADFFRFGKDQPFENGNLYSVGLEKAIKGAAAWVLLGRPEEFSPDFSSPIMKAKDE